MSIKLPKIPIFGKNIKRWGWTQSVSLTESQHVAVAHIKYGGFSSKHKHNKNWNRFVVLSGKLRIDIYRDDREETIDLIAGDVLDVEPNLWHRMTALSDVHLVEIYWPTEGLIDAEDIEREDDGGYQKPSNCDFWLVPPKEVFCFDKNIQEGTCRI